MPCSELVEPFVCPALNFLPYTLCICTHFVFPAAFPCFDSTHIERRVLCARFHPSTGDTGIRPFPWIHWKTCVDHTVTMHIVMCDT